jgi:hypothetical protein
MTDANEARVREILATVKPLAVEYYRLTGKPLGVTGEVAENIAADLLGGASLFPHYQAIDIASQFVMVALEL